MHCLDHNIPANVYFSSSSASIRVQIWRILMGRITSYLCTNGATSTLGMEGNFIAKYFVFMKTCCPGYYSRTKGDLSCFLSWAMRLNTLVLKQKLRLRVGSLIDFSLSPRFSSNRFVECGMRCRIRISKAFCHTMSFHSHPVTPKPKDLYIGL